MAVLTEEEAIGIMFHGVTEIEGKWKHGMLYVWKVEEDPEQKKKNVEKKRMVDRMNATQEYVNDRLTEVMRSTGYITEEHGHVIQIYRVGWDKGGKVAQFDVQICHGDDGVHEHSWIVSWGALRNASSKTCDAQFEVFLRTYVDGDGSETGSLWLKSEEDYERMPMYMWRDHTDKCWEEIQPKYHEAKTL